MFQPVISAVRRSATLRLHSFLIVSICLPLWTAFSFRANAAVLLDPEPESSTTLFGYSLAVLGDIDGDGHPDLVVGAPFQDGDFDNIEKGFGPPQNVGKVFLLNGVSLAVIRKLDDPAFQMVQIHKFGGQFGSSVAAAGDLNHDGITDVIVGVPHHVEADEEEAESEFNSGEAFVFSGKDGSILFTLKAPEPEEGARFGYAVSGMADVNDDGIPDLLVGEPKRDLDEDSPDEGAVYIFSGADGALLTLLLPPGSIDGRFGSAITDAGDLQEDGVHDVLVGEPGSGVVYVMSGRTGAIVVSVTVGSSRLPSFGSAVAGGKDLDGDGKLDFVVGAPLDGKLAGAAYVFNRDGSLQRTLTAKSQSFAKFGSSVAVADDLTGDGRPDILVGAPDHAVAGIRNAGEAYVFRGRDGKLSRTITSETPQVNAGFGYLLTAADLNGTGTRSIITGVPFEDADLPDSDDIETHLQIGQIELH